VLLINPRNPLGGGSIITPLGLATKASYIPDRYDVMIADENVKQANYSGADLVAVTTNTVIIHIESTYGDTNTYWPEDLGLKSGVVTSSLEKSIS